MKTIVTAKKIFTGANERPLSNHCLFYSGDKIVSVFPAEEIGQYKADDTEIYDCSSQCVSPGLIDSHVHIMLPGNGLSGEDTMKKTIGEIQVIATKNALTALQNGVTTLRDCGGIPEIVFGLKSAIDNGDICGPNIIACGAPLTPTGGHVHYMAGEVDGVDEVRKKVRQNYKHGASFTKIIATGGGTKNILPNGIMLTLPEINEAIAEAHRWHAKACAHVCTTEGIEMLLKTDIDGLEHGMFCAYDNTLDFREYLADEIARRGIVVCTTIQALVGKINYYNENGCATSSEQKEYDILRTYEDTVLRAIELTRSYIKYTIGSDAGWRISPFGAIVTGMKMMCDTGMGNIEAIHAVTGRPSDFMEISDTVGYLKPGAQADFLILDEDPEENILAFAGKKRVFLKGKEVSIRVY